jgi:hypothetical protein
MLICYPLFSSFKHTNFHIRKFPYNVNLSHKNIFNGIKIFDIYNFFLFGFNGLCCVTETKKSEILELLTRENIICNL